MPKQFVVKAHREPKLSLAYTPALRADIHTKCSIGRIGLFADLRWVRTRNQLQISGRAAAMRDQAGLRLIAKTVTGENINDFVCTFFIQPT
jgi:hypothetical protein